MCADTELTEDRAFEALVHIAGQATGVSRGYHNQNVRIELDPDYARLFGCETVKLRKRLESPLVVQRTWHDESELLGRLGAAMSGDGLAAHLVEIPRVLYDGGDRGSLHSYPEGVPLSSRFPRGEWVDARHVTVIMRFVAALAAMGSGPIPRLPADWPADGDSDGFLRDRVEFARTALAEANEEEYGELLERLGIPDDAMKRFGERLPDLTRRPFSLIHTDLHRDNILIRDDGGLVVIDWEHAMFGDPLYEVATHLCRMRYPEAQEAGVQVCWESQMARYGCESGTRGWTEDLPHYLAYEKAQSVYPDVMRALRAYEDSRHNRDEVLRRVSENLVRTLARAQGPLMSKQVPERDYIARTLQEFAGSRAA
ncbi:phosphotransferase [Actinacidiphila glaucinigra]|uniref:phosphotransferase n=1 Tax=Actinacidiphila glaucinigra TaxID=235986 RepID=UPI0032557FFF